MHDNVTGKEVVINNVCVRTWAVRWRLNHCIQSNLQLNQIVITRAEVPKPPPKQKQRWTCDVCHKEMLASSQKIHLTSSRHHTKIPWEESK
jgi:hypothetical protein